MNTEFFNALDLLEKERGISKAYMLEKVEAALVSAFKKDSGGNTNVRIVIDPDKKEIKMFKQLNVVEEVTDESAEITVADAKKVSRRYKLGDVCEIEMKTKNFGRISAQTAKQVIIQGIREAERSMMVKEYETKREEVITARVVRIDPITGNAIVDTGTSEAVLLKNEQIPGEEYEVGDHIKVFVMEVNSEVRGPVVTLSRSHFGLVKRLFELEVPEIQDGTVVIRGISREAGSRTKIAVESRDENVDAVGACIGARRCRIDNIVDELCGEKIDVIQYSDDPEEYVAAALKPAKVESVVVEGERMCRVTVEPDQLSLAIGREGQNARLAARLTGYKIDIKPV
ncbi:MAG: transcription termination/antitermination protein NusA [Clostridia bacterium]|nr:transcription termination/antitermination protein NusA [Clostridia bacterium]MBO4428590.1 transcription termination/antitermination protein NusA [Clostridia bacterium]